MEISKAENFYCPVCGNKSRYKKVAVIAELHWWDIEDGQVVDFECNLEEIDRCIIKYICNDCNQNIELQEIDKLRLHPCSKASESSKHTR